MKVKFSVMACGETSFTSPKTGRQYNRARLMGMVEDAYTKASEPAVCDLSFDAARPDLPKSGDVVLLDVVELKVTNGMLALQFSALEPFKKS